MSAKKLSRLAGLVLALAVVFGGTAVEAGATESSDAAVFNTNIVLDWE
ncbi:hypothetical protein [Actinoplanes sp. G11-F43]